MIGWRSGAVLIGAAAAIAGACGSAAGDDVAGAGGAATAGAGGSSAATAGTGANATGGSAGFAGTTLIESGIQDQGLTSDSACAAEQAQAEQVPVNIFMVQDVSGSMVNPFLGQPHWPSVLAGLTAFFQDPQSAGLRIALTYFPNPSGSCTPTDYLNPNVPLGPLTADPAPQDAQEQALISSLQANTPQLGQYTPMYGGLGGSLLAARSHMQSNPAQKAVVILVTDGIPESDVCTPDQLDVNQIAGLAADAYNDTPSVITFAIGLAGSQEQVLQLIASAGGGEAFFLGSGPGVQQALIDKLKSISGSLLACEYAMPTTEAGVVDPNLVNITFTSGAGVETQLYKVDGAAACVPSAWYYDDPVSPTKILLCPETCSLVQADPQGKMEILLGCQSLPPP